MSNLPKIEKTGLAVDIDETLSWTIGYWVEQMQKKFGNPENLSIKEIIEKYRYTQNVPYWQSEEALKWIDQKIHSNELQKDLPLIEESNIYLNKINQIIPIAAYITVRPKTVIKGTQEWLDKHDFPKAPVVCKPMNVKHADGNKWKAGLLKKLYPDIVGIIDDHIKLVECLDKDYQGKVFLYDHTTVDSQLNVVACKHWLNIYTEVKNEFKK